MRYSLFILIAISFSFSPFQATAQFEKIEIVIKVDNNTKLVSKSGLDPLYKTIVGFTDINGSYHQLPQTFMTETEDYLFKPCLYFDSVNYYIFVKSLDELFTGYVYKFNPSSGFVKETLFTGPAMGYIPFFGKLNNKEPSLYFLDRNAKDKRIIKASRSKGNWTLTPTDIPFDEHSKAYQGVPQVQVYSNSFEQYPFKVFDALNYQAYVPIWCKTDKVENARVKPIELHEDIPGSEKLIPNMPWIEMQSHLGECEAYAFGALFQQWVYSKWQGTEDEIKDFKNPPLESRVSYFGMLNKIHRDTGNRFILSYDDPRYEGKTLYKFSKYKQFLNNPFQIIRDSSKPFQNIEYALTHTNGLELSHAMSQKKREYFLLFLNGIFDDPKRRKDEKLILDSLFFYTGMEGKYFNLGKAFAKPSYDKFTESLFFDDCKYGLFPLGASILPYPIDANAGTIEHRDLKQKVIQILTEKLKPLIFVSATTIKVDGTPGEAGNHATVICGYKKVRNLKTNQIIDVFKIHNSWGEKWQLENNDGWCDADALIRSAPIRWEPGHERPVFESCIIKYLTP